MDAHFHTSLQQLRLRLDLMNSRTAAILNKSHQHSEKVTESSSQLGQSTSVMESNAQQIKHIGATVGALARQQQDRFQKLELQLNLLSDKLDNHALTDPRFTPSESPTSSVHKESKSYFDSPFEESFTMPRQTLSATVADIGGYFYPNYVQYSNSNQQCISDVLTFVGRVNRTLRTKAINNIEVFLRGSALRWFHIGLRIDGSHIFDHENGEFNIAKFCQSLTQLFGAPESSRPDTDEEATHLASSSMRSMFIDDYAFPALENARQHGIDFNFDIVLKKAIKRYNQSFTSIILDPDILKDKDLLEMLVSLRRSEFDQTLDKVLAQMRQRLDGAKSAKVPIENTQKAGASGHEAQQDSMSAIVNEYHRNGTPPISKPDDVRYSDSPNFETHEMLERSKPEVVKSSEVATKRYPPAPSAVSAPATPILPSRIPAKPWSFVPRIGSSHDQLQDIATMDSDEDYRSIPAPPRVAKKFGLQPGRQPTQQQLSQMQQQMHMQKMAQQQQKIPQRDGVVQTGDYPKSLLHQRSSELAAPEYPDCNSLTLEKRGRADVLDSATDDILAAIHDQQRVASPTNPHLFYQSGCAAVMESMERNMTRLEPGALNEQDWTNYAQMLEDHAAALAKESTREAEIPPRLAFANNRPSWLWREHER
ncbi:hypothetical protein QM012_002803 [Aureobasidium pullulans]|uniref:Prion-inhibition and propagation HeLo domain-containing protein n=1 Tax=Aureobasidium pullulans TaxID=5580 RepID=A0ABR0TAL1_AURPU